MRKQIHERKIIISASWIVILINYLYGDLAMMMFHADKYLKITSAMSSEIVFASAVFIEISILMILLTLLLKYQISRWLNIIAGIIFAAFPMVTVFIGGSPPAFYIFLSIVECIIALFIVVYAWTWKNQDV